MARKELVFTATAGRDKGKKFAITEMSAVAGHKWATRMLLALAGSGMAIDDEVLSRGMAGVASLAASAFGRIDPDALEPLMQELLSCVKSQQEKLTRSLIDDDFEEIQTIFELQKAVFMLHIEPFMSGASLTSGSPKEAP